jgi:hypothetical protein
MSEQDNSIENSTHDPSGGAKGDLSENFLTEKPDKDPAAGAPKHDDSLLPSNLKSETQRPINAPIEDELDVGGWLCL